MLQPFKVRLTPPPGKKLIRDWNGVRVRTTRPLRSGMLDVPAGTVCTVMTSGGTGLQIKTDPCPHCDVAVFMSRLGVGDVEVISESKPS